MPDKRQVNGRRKAIGRPKASDRWPVRKKEVGRRKASDRQPEKRRVNGRRQVIGRRKENGRKPVRRMGREIVGGFVALYPHRRHRRRLPSQKSRFL